MPVSASAVAKSRECERMYAFNRAMPYTESPDAKRGQLIHEMARAYHVYGKYPGDDDLGLVFKSGLHFMPRPLCGRAEGEFHARISGVDYMGYIDLECTLFDLFHTDILPQVRGMDPTIPVVIDYKSTKSLKGRHGPNGLTGPGDFLNDEQGLLYAAKALIAHPEAQHVYLRWIYLQVEGKKKAEARDVILTRKEVIEAFGSVMHKYSTRLVQIKTTKPDPMTLRFNPDRCLKYGEKYACPHIDKCNLTEMQKLLGYQSTDTTEEKQGMEKTGNLLAELEAMESEAEDPTPAPAPKGINPPEKSQALAKTVTKPSDLLAANKTEVMPTRAATDSDAEVGRAFMTILRAVRSVFN